MSTAPLTNHKPLALCVYVILPRPNTEKYNNAPKYTKNTSVDENTQMGGKSVIKPENQLLHHYVSIYEQKGPHYCENIPLRDIRLEKI